MHRAGAALGKPAAEMGIGHAKIVSQRIEQRHVGIGLDRVGFPVDPKREFFSHGGSFLTRSLATSLGSAVWQSHGGKRGDSVRGNRMRADSSYHIVASVVAGLWY